MKEVNINSNRQKWDLIRVSASNRAEEEPDLSSEVALNQFRSIVLHKIYPSPASNYIKFDISSLEVKNLNVGIYNGMGALVDQRVLQLESGLNKIHWDIGNLPAGYYQILFESSTSHTPIRFIKQRL